MADTKITALTALTAADPANDVIPIVDVSDTSMAASGTTKKISVNNILSSSPTASGALTVTGLVTAGSATITGDLTVRTTGLTVNSSGVGVGTSSQSSFLGNSPKKLVIGDGTQTPALTLYGGTANVSGIYYAKGTVGNEAYRGFIEYNHAVDALTVGISGSTAMTLNSTGLGIGQSPTANLDVQGNASTGANNSVTGALTRMRDIYTRFRANSAGISGDVYAAQLFGGSNAAFEIYSMTSYPLVFGTNATERMRIDSSGNVGIGITPSAWATATTIWRALDLQYSCGIASSGAGSGEIDFLWNAYYDQTDQRWEFKYTGDRASRYAIGGAGVHTWYNTASTGTANLPITWVPAMTLDASGNLLVGVTSANANGGVLQLKSGITFPATQVAASDANTLDDYEEGTWSPTVTSEFGTIGTTTVISANYTKIGRVVSVNFDVRVDTLGTGSGGLVVSLPFSGVGAETCGAGREIINTGNMCQVVRQSSTTASVRFYNNLTVIANTNRVACSYTYFV